MSKIKRVIMIMTYRKVFTDSDDVLESREIIVDYDTGARCKYAYYPPKKVCKAIDMKVPDFRCEIYRNMMWKLIRRWDIKDD